MGMVEKKMREETAEMRTIIDNQENKITLLENEIGKTKTDKPFFSSVLTGDNPREDMTIPRLQLTNTTNKEAFILRENNRTRNTSTSKTDT